MNASTGLSQPAGGSPTRMDALDAFFRMSLDMLCIANVDGTFRRVSSAFSTLGYSESELLTRPFLDFVHPDDRAATLAEVAKLREGVPTIDFENRYLCRDGSYRWLSWTSAPDADGTLYAVARDVTERRANEEVRSFLAAIVDGSEDAILGLDVEGHILSWNRAAERMLGYSPGEVVGRSVSLLVPEGETNDVNARVQALRRGERVAPYEAIHRRKDGREFDVLVSLSEMRDPSGKLVGMSKSIRDISQLKQTERELKRARDAAEAANKELESFSYSVAHDLRAPLRGIDGFSLALLEDYSDRLDDEGKRYLGLVRESAQFMARLIDDMLTLSRVARSEMRDEVLDLSELARGTIERCRRLEPSRQVDVTIQEGLSARGDARLVAVVLENLLGNAWKFTGKTSGATIEFGVTDHQGSAAYFVRDNGAGFDMAYADKLFGLFQRLHAARDFDGTGVGLATVQRIVHRHGGRVWAKGKLDEGATFFFTLGEAEGSK